MLTAVRIGPTTSISTKTTPTKARAGVSPSPVSTARIVKPVATAKTAGSAPLSTSRIHQAVVSRASARGSAAKNCHSCRVRSRSIMQRTLPRTTDTP